MGTDNSTWHLGRGSICSLRGLWRAAQPLYQHVEMPFLWAQLCASQILIQLHLYHLSTPDSRHFLHGAQTRTRNKAPWRAQVDAAMPLCLLAMSADNDPHHADFFHCTSRYKRIHRIHEYPFITESISSCMRFRLAVPKMAPWQLEWVASRIRSTFEILQMLILYCYVL